MNENKKKYIVLAVLTVFMGILGGMGFYKANKDAETEEIIQNAVTEIKDYITTYNMSQEEIEELPTTEIIEQTEEQEDAQEQEVESEEFELQGEIAYEGSSEYPQVALGDYTGLTYYNQTDSRWRNHSYTSTGSSRTTTTTPWWSPPMWAVWPGPGPSPRS